MTFVAPTGVPGLTIHSIKGQRWPRSAFGAIPAFTLPDIITPGTGTKVTVDSKGRVVTLAAAGESDITGLSADLAAINALLTADDGRLTALESAIAPSLEPVTNGDPSSPEIVFSDGDVVMVAV